MSRFQSNRTRPSCDTCHQTFSRLSTLRRHIRSAHITKERPRFPCTLPECEKTYLNKDHLSRHVNFEHAVNPARFRCALCGMGVNRKELLERHIPTHTTEKPYSCATCGKSFTEKSRVKSHEVNRRDSVNKIETLPTCMLILQKTHLEKSNRLMAKCPLCPKTFFTRDGLQKHIRVGHANRRDYPCISCDKRFSSSSHLKRHVEARHVNDKKLIYSCDKCDYKSHSSDNFASHRVRHNPAKHGCYFCGKKFFQSYELACHFRVHTMET